MRTVSKEFNAAAAADSRMITGQIEVYKDGTLIKTLLPTDYISSFVISGDSIGGKAFGYIVSNRITISLIDYEDELEFKEGYTFKAKLGFNEESVTYPDFILKKEGIKRDEAAKTWELEAFDKTQLFQLKRDNLNFPYPLNMTSIGHLIAESIGLKAKFDFTPINDELYTEDKPINVDGSGTLWDLLEDYCEANGCICFIDGDNYLRFRRPIADTAAGLYSIDDEDYFSLTKGETMTLTGILHATQLGDNMLVGTENSFVQIIWDNAFLQNRDDIAEILTPAITDFSFFPYELDWRGNPALEPFDRVQLKIGTKVLGTVPVFSFKIEYNGGLNEGFGWTNAESNKADAPASSSVGEVIKSTYAKVDKVAGKVEIVVEDTASNASNISRIQQTQDQLQFNVSKLETETTDSLNGLDERIDTLKSSVDLKLDKEAVNVEIKKELEAGVDKVTTKTGFTFNEEGLTVSKNTSEMSTQITEDGMRVYKNDTEMLTANNSGVNAKNLSATTYLIIGDRSRLENYDEGSRRFTACFWID